MYGLLYSSDAVGNVDKSQLKEILDVSIQHNAQNGITGILLYRDGMFMQFLEGNQAVVQSLYHDKIAKDTRHNNCQVVHDGELMHRNLETWSMGFLLVESGQFNYQYVDFVLELVNRYFHPDAKIFHEKIVQFATVSSHATTV